MRHQRFAGISCSLLFLLIATPATAATWVVTSTTDPTIGNPANCLGSGLTCTLRDALASAGSGDIIAFNFVDNNQTITLASTLTIATNLTIDGARSPGLTISGGNAVRVFNVTGANATFVHLTIANGNSNAGGAIIDDISATVTLDSCTLRNNTANGGGAIHSVGTLNVVNSTFSGNTAIGAGGAILFAGSLTARNSTFVGNSTQYSGGGIFQNGGTGTVTNTLFLGNTAPQGWGGSIDTFGSMQADHNLYWNNADLNGTQGTNCNGCVTNTNAVTADPVLGSFADNGGPTWTFLPGVGSAAVDAGDDSVCGAAPVNAVDQRGIQRPHSAHCDIGAVEARFWLVTSTADPANGNPANCLGSTCTLRDALAAAVNGDMIYFAVGPDQTITLASTLRVATNVIIDGADSPGLVISGGHAVQVFGVTVANVTFAHLTIANGIISGGGGGLIIGYDSGTVTLDSCALRDNAAFYGGAILSYGTLNVVNSTFSGNIATGAGGGSGGAILSYGSLTVRNSTFVGNISNQALGGGIFQNGGAGTVTNTLFLGNTALQGWGGSIDTGGGMQADHNLYWNNADLNGTQGTNCNGCTTNTNAVTADPKLGSFANNGGPTWTFLPGVGSAALDAGDDSVCSGAPVNAVDQRGIARPQGAHCDIGAVETTHPADTIFFDGFDAGIP